MDLAFFEKVKKRTIAALMNDDVLLGLLVLKGGNALNLAYDLSNRGSIDLDFSMESDFSASDKNRIQNQLDYLLNNEFSREGLVAFDIKFLEKPKVIAEEVQDFWGGYNIEFKLIDQKKYELHKDATNLGRRALPIGKNNSTRFTVDISKYEYVNQKKRTDIDGTSLYVYTPEMLVIEKLRAVCQQVQEYKAIVIKMTPKSRSRDFYDIHTLLTSFPIDLGTPKNQSLAKLIFEAKKVPLSYLDKLSEYRDFHSQSWESVKQTVDPNEVLEPFDFYFDFVIKQSARLLS